MLCRVNKKQPVFVFKIWVLFAPQTPIDFHLTTSTWFLWIAKNWNKPLGKCQKIFPTAKRFCCSGDEVWQSGLQLLFLPKTFWLLESTKVWIGSQRRARSEAYPRAPKLTNSFKETTLVSQHSLSIFERSSSDNFTCRSTLWGARPAAAAGQGGEMLEGSGRKEMVQCGGWAADCRI